MKLIFFIDNNIMSEQPKMKNVLNRYYENEDGEE